ncbi:MAG TPA: FimV/HubP family polar landmark protein [Gallionellaceae bacterium]|nr:FimV/HubP family polar landmark protein [Gallionellaceae bacterium]
MLKSFVKVLVAMACLMWAGMAGAVGFGSATVSSALGQPLKVEIALKDVSGSGASGLTARLASPDAFKAAGLDYPYHLSRLKFQIVTRNDQAYIDITSKDPVNDSFINLLVELSWNSGKLLREYTFLLDPPDYKATMPKAEAVAPIEPVIVPAPAEEAPAVAPLPPATAASAPAAAQPEEAAAPASAPAAAEISATAAASQPATTNPPAVPGAQASAAAAPPAAETAAPKTTEQPEMTAQPAKEQPARHKAAAVTIRVKRGDTLTKIASRVMEPDVTLEQMLVALYRANERQFDGRNMNRIRAGKILRMPSEDAFDHLSNTEAVKVIRIQTANWNAYRQKLASVGTSVSEQPKQRAGGKISTNVVDQTPVKKPGNNGTLQISKGAAPGAGSTAQQAKEQAVANKQAAAEDKTRIAQLEQQIQEMNKVQALKQKPSVLTLKSGVQPPAETASAPAHPGTLGAVPPKPAMKHKFVPPPPKPVAQPSFLDDLLSPITDSDFAKEYTFLQNPVSVLAVLGGVILLIGGGVFAIRSRRNAGGRPAKKKKISFGFGKKK